MNWLPAKRTTLYAQLAFASVVLATFLQLAFVDRLEGPPWRVAVTFGLAVIHVVLFTTCNALTNGRPRWRLRVYFVVQTAIVATMIGCSPARGFFAILALPLVSQAIFDLDWRGAALVTATVFAASIAIWGVAFGGGALARAALSWAPAYFFTIAFTIISREALSAREKAEQLSAELSAANALLRTQAAQTEELATTRERNRLAREIHDGVGHYLTTIKVQLDAASALFPTDAPRAAESVRKAARLSAEALADVRRSVAALAADATRPPFVETLRQLVADGSPPPTLQIEGTPRPLAAAAEHALFRSAQEGLTNVRKHAAATAATLTLDFRAPQRVRLTLVDNGRGAPAVAQRINGDGYGLRGLRERIALLGGAMHAGAHPDGGFCLEVELPA